MVLNIATPWHTESFDRFVNDGLPGLLADRLPLSGYQAECGESTCRLKIMLGDIEIAFDILRPDERGVFRIRDGHMIVLPVASNEYLDTAEIKCVGERLLDYIGERLGEAPKDIPWDEPLIRSWLPLDTWVAEAVEEIGQWLDKTDWLATTTHSRRVLVPTREKVITPSQFGRTCPFNTPEGPNIGRVLDIAVGAEIRDGRLVITDGRPEANLGLAASLIPFLEHNDPNRLNFGANMIRQWMPPPEPEPALVQTGNEPSTAGFWCGRNLLTAFVSWGPDTYEDGILISESCAKRLNYPDPAEPGDKLSNRHGAKGVVSRILPDDEMPHLPDGTPVELVYNFIALHARLNFGQIREAVASRIARAEGSPFIAPPFHAPDEKELRDRLRAAGLPEDGMETLSIGKSGKKLARPSTVGWVYWGRTVHTALSKIHASVTPDGRCNMQAELEYYALRDAGAFENLAEQFNTRAAEREDADGFAERVASGEVEQAGPPTPRFAELTRRLSAGGIRAEIRDEKLTFGFAPPEGDSLKLAHPVPHPWLSDQTLIEIGAFGGLREYDVLVEANARMERMMSAPESLKQKALADLEQRVKEYLDVLLTPENLRMSARILFSGRTMLAPGVDLRLDQLGIADEMAWIIFGPLVAREIGGEEVRLRSDRATKTLDDIMARSWILLNRAPTVMPTSILAFHPVRTKDRAIRLHPLACMLMNADFDGDQTAIYLPVTEAGQKEAGEQLSIAGHLRRDPSLVTWVFPNHEALWGLATLSMNTAGRKQIEKIAGMEIAAPEGFVTRSSVTQALKTIMEREGVERLLDVAQELLALGFEAAKESGASMNPFIGENLWKPALPEADDPEGWQKAAEEMAESIASRSDFSDDDLGPQLLAVKSGARGSLGSLQRLVGPTVVSSSIHGDRNPIRHGFNEGLTAEEMFVCVVGAREGLDAIQIEIVQAGYGIRGYSGPKGFAVLNRAMRSAHPGVVFARAAAVGESDPLADVDSRLFIGLPVDKAARTM